MCYTILHELENKTCDRCGANIRTGVQLFSDGKYIVVGRECAKHYGIIWTSAIGVMAQDAATIAKARSIWQYRHHAPYQWLNGWDYCEHIKIELGAIAWNAVRDQTYREMHGL